MPSFSIVTPTLGVSRFLTDSLDSISDSRLDSECQVEHLLVASPGFRLPRSYPSVRVIESAANGASDAFNLGLEQAQGEFIGCLADDDMYFPGTLDRVKAVFENDLEVDLIYGGFARIDEDGVANRYYQPRRLTRSRVKRFSDGLQPSLFFRRKVYEQIGPLDPSLEYHYWYDFVLRCFVSGLKCHRLRDCLAGKRRHRGNRHHGDRTAAGQVAASIERVQLVSSRLGEVPATVALALGRHCALQQGFDPIKPGYDGKVLENATRGVRSLHLSDGQESMWVAGIKWLQLRRAHLRYEAVQMAKYPREVARFMPDKIRNYFRGFFRSRLFQLHQHAPRAPRALRLATATDRRPSELLSIGIVTPNYNAADYLSRTIESVVDQRFPRLQYVVQDGASTDYSVDVIKNYADRLHHWDSRHDTGQTQAINRGLSCVDSDVMAYLNSDDILLPGSLAYVSEYFRTHPDVDVIYGHRLIIDGDDQEIGRWVLPKHDDRAITFADYVPQETMFWRRRAWEAVGAKLDESFQFAMDWDLILRFRAAGMKFERVSRFLGAFRVIESQKTQVLLETLGETEMNRLRRRELGRIPTSREWRRAMRPYRIRQWFQHHAYTISEVSIG